MKLIQSLALALCLLSSAPLASFAQDAQPAPALVVHVTRDDAWAGLKGLTFARNVQKAGGDVVVFLNVRAVSLANENVPQQAGAMSDKTAHDVIAEIVAGGGRVFACPGCTRQAGLDIADRIDGVEPGGPEVLDTMMAPDTRIISF